jgi:hypothetical protein
MTSATAQLTALLNSLAKRAHTRDTQDFGVAVGLVNDLGRLVLRGRESDVRQAQAAVSAVREQLRDGDGIASPAQTLEGPLSRSFLAGALWAVNEIMTTRLDALPSSPEHARATRSGRVKEMVLATLTSQESQSPTTILHSIAERDPATRFDEVSRAITDMMAAGLIETVPAPAGTDRRMKYLALTSQGHAVAAKSLEIA